MKIRGSGLVAGFFFDAVGLGEAKGILDCCVQWHPVSSYSTRIVYLHDKASIQDGIAVSLQAPKECDPLRDEKVFISRERFLKLSTRTTFGNHTGFRKSSLWLF